MGCTKTQIWAHENNFTTSSQTWLDQFASSRLYNSSKLQQWTVSNYLTTRTLWQAINNARQIERTLSTFHATNLILCAISKYELYKILRATNKIFILTPSTHISKTFWGNVNSGLLVMFAKLMASKRVNLIASILQQHSLWSSYPNRLANPTSSTKWTQAGLDAIPIFQIWLFWTQIRIRQSW